MCEAPSGHALVALIGRAVAGFFMTPQLEVADAQFDRRERVNHFATARDELEAEAS